MPRENFLSRRRGRREGKWIERRLGRSIFAKDESLLCSDNDGKHSGRVRGKKDGEKWIGDIVQGHVRPKVNDVLGCIKREKGKAFLR